MKNILSIFVVAAVFSLSGLTSLAADEAKVNGDAPAVETQAAAAAAAEPAAEESGGGVGTNLCNMGRGVVNIGTCWLEVFRCMLYRNSEVPFFGFVYGACEGAGFTVMRAFTGVTDILFLGFEPANIFEPRFSEFVWESPWLPVKELQFKTPVLPQD